MSSARPAMIAVAPNGARKTSQDHPALPISPTELAKTAAACHEAGACMIHLHVRDEQNRHSLDPERYRAAINAIRKETAENLIIQITTEAVGIYSPEQQMQVVRDLKPQAVSLAVRELCATGHDDLALANFFQWLYLERICPQYILYDSEDIRQLATLIARGLIPDDRLHVLLVLGRYQKTQESDPADLAPLQESLSTHWHWWLCAFGAREAACMERAVALGGHCRVGFENNLYLPGGELAPDNAALVSTVVDLIAQSSRPLASTDDARELFWNGVMVNRK